MTLKFNSKGFSLVELLLTLTVLIVLVLLGLFIWHEQSNQSTLTKEASSSRSQLNGAPNKPSTKVRYFIMSTQVLNSMVANPRARLAIKNDYIFVINNPKIQLSSLTAGLKLIKTEDFTSEAQLANHIDNLPLNTKAVLYDNEPWSYTPQNEQQNILYYYQQAAKLVHQHNLSLIATPVISNVVGDKTNINLFVQIAKIANVFDIQSQYDQNITSMYLGHVKPIAQAIAQASPSTIILSGLSTNPRAGIPTPAQLDADAFSVSPYVSGYWLNIPNKPANCSTIKSSTNGRCAGPQPQIGIQFLMNLR